MATAAKPPVTATADPATPKKRGGRQPGAKNKPPHAKVKLDDPERFEDMDPLAFLLRQMNDRTLDPAVRQRAAIAAAQYVHTKTKDGGKKEARQKAAAAAAAGKKPGSFTPMSAPVTPIKKVA